MSGFPVDDPFDCSEIGTQNMSYGIFRIPWRVGRFNAHMVDLLIVTYYLV